MQKKKKQNSIFPSLHSVSDLKTMSEIEEREVTWTLEKGYMDRSRFLDNYPMNDVGGMFGKPYSFIFSVLSDKLTYNCESFQGFKVSQRFIINYLRYCTIIILFFLLLYERLFCIHPMICQYTRLITSKFLLKLMYEYRLRRKWPQLQRRLWTIHHNCK